MKRVIVCLIVGLVLAGTATAAAPEAKVCQKGGWADTVRTGDATGFSSQKECQAYKGSYSQLKVSTVCSPIGADFCLGWGGFGLKPGSTVEFRFDLGSGGFGSHYLTVAANGIVAYHNSLSLTCDGCAPETHHYSAYALGVTSAGVAFTSKTITGEVSLP